MSCPFASEKTKMLHVWQQRGLDLHRMTSRIRQQFNSLN